MANNQGLDTHGQKKKWPRLKRFRRVGAISGAIIGLGLASYEGNVKSAYHASKKEYADTAGVIEKNQAKLTGKPVVKIPVGKTWRTKIAGPNLVNIGKIKIAKRAVHHISPVPGNPLNSRGAKIAGIGAAIGFGFAATGAKFAGRRRRGRN